MKDRLMLTGVLVAMSAFGGYRRGELLGEWSFAEKPAGEFAGDVQWVANGGKNGDGAFRFRSTSKTQTSMVTLPLGGDELRGIVQIEADVKGIEVGAGDHHWNGPKVMFPHENERGKDYPEMPKEFGTFDWKTKVMVFEFSKQAKNIRMALGLEAAPGELWVDAVRVYRAEEVPDDAASTAPPNELAARIPRGPFKGRHNPRALRGVMSGGDLTDASFDNLVSWNANLVRLQIGIETKEQKTLDDWFAALDAKLDEVAVVLGRCRIRGIRAVLDLHGGPGCLTTKHASNVIPDDYDPEPIKEAWRRIARRFAGDSAVYGYDILNEPAATLETWDRLFLDVTREIRKIDPKTPVITEFCHRFFDGENVIYSPHFYSPHTYTHAGVVSAGGVRWSYPGYIDGVYWDAEQMRIDLEPWIRFSLAHPEARILIGEFSAIVWAKGADRYIRDAISVFEEYGWDWTYHAYREWPAWDVEYTHVGDYEVGKWQKASGDTLRKQALLDGLSHNRRAARMTVWGEKVTPENAWRDYPRPQMVRSNWTCLNGLWDYAITPVVGTAKRPTDWTGKILVPFAIESELSGVGRLLEEDEFLWYARKIQVEKKDGERTLLHFDGVDFRAMVFVGHHEVTDVPHAGAQEPFTLDITDFVEDGTNELTVCVWDPTEGHVGSIGKQSERPGGCFYTRVSGIWQSVWMETVPDVHFKDYNVIADIDRGVVELTFDIADHAGERVSVEVEGVGRFEGGRRILVKMPADFGLWSPEHPKLYPFVATCGRDSVRGYFAMRKFSKGRDSEGRLRFCLNNRPYYVMATLDQGWWPDGLLTPPSDAAMAFDISTLKSCGFNAMRKHIKVEPRRYYHLCDTMGLLVIQDLPCFNGDFTSMYRAETVKGFGFQRHELKAMIDNLRKTPSIVMWVPYNEGWSQPGEFLTHVTLDWTKRYDPTRMVDGPSGFHDFEGGDIRTPKGDWKWDAFPHRPTGECEAGDAVDRHLYRGPGMFAVNDRRVSFLGEWGGLGHAVSNHLWSVASGNWGYGGTGDTDTKEGLTKVYLDLASRLAQLAAEGLGGSVYTQTTDVESEINGLMTYDRRVLKIDANQLRDAHEAVIRKAEGER
jgi:hypothetical protein